MTLQDKKHASDCCAAEVKTVGDSFGEGTMHWECEKCGESCNDTFYSSYPKENAGWEERFDRRFDEFRGTLKIVGWDKEKDEPVNREPFTSEDLKDFIRSEIKATKQRVRDEIHAELNHEQQKLVDGFGHPKDCERCLSTKEN